MDSHNFKFKLGKEAKDIVTGFTGIIMGRTNYATGCDHYGLLSKKLSKNGTTQDWQWFDDSRLKLTKGKSIVFNKAELRKDPGGPQPAAPSN